MTQLTDPQSQAIGFDYDPEGNLTKTTLPNGIVTTNAYDGVGRMLRTSSERQGTILQSFDYAYGSAGNRTSQTDRNNEVTTYTYDALSRLTELDPPADPPVAYAYDAAGNRTEADGVTYTYNALNQLTGDSTGTSYVYDRAGRLVERRDGSQTTTYTRDALDQLIRVDDGSNPIAYSYDALGRRSERTEGGATESAHYGDLTDAPILDTDASGIIESYVRGAAGLVEQRAGATRFPLSDAHGDVTAIADTDGTVASRHSYDPWGEQLSGHELQFGWLGAIGLRTDSAAALSQMGVRSYVPGLGRFATEDPIIGYYGVGQSVNRFTYVWNDPVNRYDPMGLGPCVLGFIGCDEADDPCDSLLSGPMLPLCLVPGSAEDDFVNASAGFGDGLTSNPLSSLGIGPNVSVTRTLRDDILDKPGNIDYDSEAYGLGNVAGDAGRFGLGATYRWYKYRPRPNEWPVEHPPRDLDPLP